MDQPARVRAVFDLFAAHRELSALEWAEFKRAMMAAAVCAVLAAAFAITAWLTVNVGVLLWLRADPVRAALVVGGGNLVAALLATWQVVRLLGRPFFALTRREAAEDARNLVRVLS